MKPIIRSRKFEKNFKSRISPSLKLKKQFQARLQLFAEGVRIIHWMTILWLAQ
jgi:hypothetical protein